MSKTVSLVKPYNVATSVFFDGSAATDLANVAGNITNGYTFTANSSTVTEDGTVIKVGDEYIDHAWKILGSTAATESIVGGNGADTLFGGSDAKHDSLVGGAGKDVFVMDGNGTGTDVIEDFSYGEDVIFAGSAVNYKVAADRLAADGTITIGTTNIKVVDTDSDGIYKATVANATSSTNVWYSNGASVYMDASAETSALVLDGYQAGADTLVGGSGKDTIWAGANDLAYGGAGADEIAITASGATNVGVVLTTAGGTDKVANFTFGTSVASADYVDLFENSISEATIAYSKGNVTTTLGSASLVIKATDAQYKDVVVRDNTGANYVVAVANAAQGSTIELQGNENYVIGVAGYNTAVQAQNSNDVVDLSSTYDANTVYQNIKTVIGSTGNDTIIGAAATNNSLAGGTGADSIWGGGASNDTLTGGTGSDADMFWFGLGDGSDVITDYDAGTDSIRLTSAGQVASATRSTKTSDVTITMTDGSTLTVEGTSNASDDLTMNLGDDVVVKAEVGKTGAKNSFSATNANYFYGSTSTDTLKVTGSSTAVTNNGVSAVYLDNRLEGTGYYSIENVDASSSTATLELAGDSASNVITAGQGNASLWGGAGATADTLVGGTGTNTYYFGKGEGNDTITKSTASDQVMLYNVASTDIASGVLSSTGVMTVTLTDGSSLAIKGYNANSVATFTLTDGTYTYDYTGKTWDFKKNA